MKVVMVGAGNVGYHLGKALHQVGYSIVQVFSRSGKKAADLAAEVNSEWTTSLNGLPPDADLYLIAVSDTAIGEVAAQLVLRPGAVVAHTSGATSSQILQSFFPVYGVFYPLQSFSRQKPVDFRDIPICIHSNENAGLSVLQSVANSITQKVHRVNDEQREWLHVSAVFVNNFTNYLFTAANHLMEQAEMDLDILQPLIEETINKIKKYPPKDMQTGPARRQDDVTLQKHLALLESHPAFREIYALLSRQIKDLYKK